MKKITIMTTMSRIKDVVEKSDKELAKNLPFLMVMWTPGVIREVLLDRGVEITKGQALSIMDLIAQRAQNQNIEITEAYIASVAAELGLMDISPTDAALVGDFLKIRHPEGISGVYGLNTDNPVSINALSVSDIQGLFANWNEPITREHARVLLLECVNQFSVADPEIRDRLIDLAQEKGFRTEKTLEWTND